MLNKNEVVLDLMGLGALMHEQRWMNVNTKYTILHENIRKKQF